MVRIKLNRLHIARQVLLVSVTINLMACTTYKKVTEYKYFTNKVVTNPTETIEHPVILPAYPDLKTFSAKFKLASKSMEDINDLKGVLRIQRDSIIWLNINLDNGITVAKALFSTDSFKVYNRIDKSLYEGIYAEFNARYGVSVNFQIIQSILLHDFYADYQPESTYYLPVTANDTITRGITFTDKHSTQIFNYWIDILSGEINSSSIISDEIILTTTYSEPEKEKKLFFPEKLAVKWQDSEQVKDIEIEYSKIEFNPKVEFPFNVPRR